MYSKWFWEFSFWLQGGYYGYGLCFKKYVIAFVTVYDFRFFSYTIIDHNIVYTYQLTHFQLVFNISIASIVQYSNIDDYVTRSSS